MRFPLAILAFVLVPLALPNRAVSDDAKQSTKKSDREKANAECPFSGRAVDPEEWIFSEGKRVLFCCANCTGKFTLEKENRLSAEERKAGWRLVFNGRDLDGFAPPTRTGKWSVEDGILSATGGPGVLGTKESYRDFELRFDAEVYDTGERRGNSGVFIRGPDLLGFRGRWPNGLEVQIDHGDPNFWTGAIWKIAKAKKVKTRDKEWFQLRIRAEGKLVRVWVNGELVTEHEQKDDPAAGPIAFQVHHATDVVRLKNVKVRALESKKARSKK